MTDKVSTRLSNTSPIPLPEHRCPACGMPAPAALVVLPSGRRAFIEACAICGRQDATAVTPRQAAALLEGRERHATQAAG